MRWDLAPLFVTLALGAAALEPGCTTYVQPTTCAPGSTGCDGITDARFCEYVAVAVEGPDCASLGLTASKPFCVVTSKCIDTDYAVRDRACRVVRYQAVSDSVREECAPGAPVFATR